FKAAWKDDTHAVPLDPLDFISRLCPPHPDASLPHAARPRRARGTHHHRAPRGVPGREPPRPDAQLPLFRPRAPPPPRTVAAQSPSLAVPPHAGGSASTSRRGPCPAAADALARHRDRDLRRARAARADVPMGRADATTAEPVVLEGAALRASERAALAPRGGAPDERAHHARRGVACPALRRRSHLAGGGSSPRSRSPSAVKRRP